MRKALRSVSVALVLAVTAAACLALSAPVAQAADGCSYDRPFSPKVTSVAGRTVELRANNHPYACAWGRLSNGRPGDQVWVDRSWDGGRTWQQLSLQQLRTGAQIYTEAYNDVAYVMRACGSPWVGYELIACTGWW